MLTLSKFEPVHLLDLPVHPLHRKQIAGPWDKDFAARHAEAGPAWSVLDGAEVVGCGGFGHVFPHYVVAWGAVSTAVGARHLALTRLVRDWIDRQSWQRIEAACYADWPNAARWARMLGFRQFAVQRFGAADGRDNLLFERVRP